MVLYFSESVHFMQFKCMFRNSWSWKYLVNTKRIKNNKKNRIIMYNSIQFNFKINNSEESVLRCGHQYRNPQSVSLIKVHF